MAGSSLVKKGAAKATDYAFQEDGTLKPGPAGVLSKALSVQRPVVLAYVRSVRRRNPEATPDELITIIAKHYLLVSTGTGAAVGATAVIPGLGTAAALGVAAAETGGFLELSALFAQSMAEVHGIAVSDQKRANALVMGLMLGKSGKDLVKRFAGQSSGGEKLTGNWGSLVAGSLPAGVVDQLTRRMRKMIIKRYAARSAASTFGRILPFGIGAVIGGAVNHKLAKNVVENAANAFGPAPAQFSEELNPKETDPKTDSDLMAGFKKFITSRKRAQQKAKALEKAKAQVQASEGGDAESSSSDGSDVPDANDSAKTYRPDVKL